jgi:hypothetical protein
VGNKIMDTNDFNIGDQIHTTFGIFVVVGGDRKDKTLVIKKYTDIIDEMIEMGI